MALGDATLRVIFAADTAAGIRGLKDASITIRDMEAALKRLKDASKDATGPALETFNAQIKGLSDALKQARTAGLEPAVTGLGKVAKGAEEAFGAVRKLAYILPGIGIAGIFDLAITGITKLVNSTKAAEEELAKFKEKFKAIGDISGEAIGSQAGSIERVRALAKAVNDSSLSFDEQKRALDLLKETNKAYFGDLTKGTATVETLTKRTNEYAEALVAAAVVKGFTDAIAEGTKEFNKQNDALVKTKTALDAARKAQEDLNKVAKELQARGASATTLGGVEQDQRKAAGALKEANDAFLQQRDKVELASQAIGEYHGQLTKAIQEQLKFNLITPLKDKVGKPEEDPFLKTRFKAFINPDVQIQEPEPQQINDEVDDFMKALEKNIEKTFKKLPDIKIPAPHMTFEEKELQKRIDTITAQLKNLVTSGIENVATGIGDALSGKGFGAVISSFAHTIGEGLKTVGKILIEASLKMAAIQKAAEALATANPIIGVAAGIAAIVAGTLIENIAQQNIKATPFASGGIVTGPTLGLVGEAGPEAIIPLDKLNQWMRGARTGNNMNVNGEFTIRGNDLIAVLARANKNQGLV